MLKEIIFSVFDGLATYDLTKQANDLLPVLAMLMPVCEPLSQRIRTGEKLQPKEAYTLKVYYILNEAYQTDILEIDRRTDLLETLGVLGQLIDI